MTACSSPARTEERISSTRAVGGWKRLLISNGPTKFASLGSAFSWNLTLLAEAEAPVKNGCALGNSNRNWSQKWIHFASWTFFILCFQKSRSFGCSMRSWGPFESMILKKWRVKSTAIASSCLHRSLNWDFIVLPYISLCSHRSCAKFATKLDTSSMVVWKLVTNRKKTSSLYLDSATYFLMIDAISTARLTSCPMYRWFSLLASLPSSAFWVSRATVPTSPTAESAGGGSKCAVLCNVSAITFHTCAMTKLAPSTRLPVVGVVYTDQLVSAG